MNTTKRNVLELVLQVLCLVMVFIPGTFIKEHWVWDRDASTTVFGVNFHGVMSLDRETGVSLFECIFESGNLQNILGIVLLAVILITIALMIRQVVSGGNSKSATIFAMASFLVFIGFSVAQLFAQYEAISFRDEYALGWLFYIYAIIFAATACVTLIGYLVASKKGVLEEPVKEEVANVDFYSTADELLKYKELLDAGAITPDEFNDIKQKLL